MRRRLVAAALATFAAAGCADSAQAPQTLPPLSPRAPASAAPSPVAVPSPSLTGEKAPIEQALLSYYAALNAATVTGDLSTYKAVHTADCSACAEFEKLLTDYAAKGQRFDGAGDAITAYSITNVTGDSVLADVRFTIPAYRIVTADGGVVGSYDAQPQRNIVTLRRVGGRWLVAGVTKRAL